MVADLFEVHVPLLELMLRGTLVYWLLGLLSSRNSPVTGCHAHSGSQGYAGRSRM